jgi:hypothetical protein
VVEEPDVVVLLLQRSDLALDEVVDLAQELDEILWQLEVHVVPSPVAAAPARDPHRSWPVGTAIDERGGRIRSDRASGRSPRGRSYGTSTILPTA